MPELQPQCAGVQPELGTAIGHDAVAACEKANLLDLHGKRAGKLLAQGIRYCSIARTT